MAKHDLVLHIATSDRHSEMFTLLQSLLNQSFKEWDLVVVDQSQTPIQSHYLFNEILWELKRLGHKVRVERSKIAGVVSNRNQCFEVMEKMGDYKYSARIDDDSYCATDYLERLYAVIKEDACIGAVGGVVPNYGQPGFKRDIKHVKPIFNKIYIEEDNLVIGDDGGWEYTEDIILPSHHLRSSFMINNEAAREVGLYSQEFNGGSAFREESDFCLKLLEKGYKLFTDTGAKCWHYRTPSGGCRISNYGESVQKLDAHFREKWAKRIKHGRLKL